MTRSPIETLIDRVDLLCARCGVSLSIGCQCWLILRCPTCGTEKQTEREWFDPPAAVVMVALCNPCRTAEWEPRWLDKEGREVT